MGFCFCCCSKVSHLIYSRLIIEKTIWKMSISKSFNFKIIKPHTIIVITCQCLSNNDIIIAKASSLNKVFNFDTSF